MVWSGPLHNFASWTKGWSPFRLDALGLVTLLGADEIARNIGSLTRNTYTDFLPVFGAYKVAANQFATQEAGFMLYNLTDGIAVTEMNGWITRWLASNLDAKFTILKMSVRDQPRKHCKRTYLALAIGLVAGLGLMALALAQADWYGLANAVAMIVATIIRNYLLGFLRGFLDKKAMKVFATTPTKTEPVSEKAIFTGTRYAHTTVAAVPMTAEDASIKLRPAVTKPGLDPDGIVKLLMVLPDGRVAISFTQRGMVPLMLASLDEPAEQPLYRIARAFGWLAFAVHIITIGQAYLLTQIITVFLMASATISTIVRFGVHREHQIGSLISIKQLELGHHLFGSKNSRRTLWQFRERLHDKHKAPKKLGRSDIYVRLDPGEGTREREYLHRWSLFPQLGNPSTDAWVADFDKKLERWHDDMRDSGDESFALERNFLGQPAGYRDSPLSLRI